MHAQKRTWRNLRVAACLMVLLAAFPHTAFARTTVALHPPVGTLDVIKEFRAPQTPYGSGHRGVDVFAEPGTPVVASADGLVTFAGTVGGLTWVSITHMHGYHTSYGPLTQLVVKAGDVVTAKQQIGVLAVGGHGPNRGDTGLHFSLRVNGAYRDPFPYFLPVTSRLSLVGAELWEAGGAPERYRSTWRGNRLGGVIVAGSETARLPHRFYPPNEAHLVLINGLATNSDTMLIDPVLLGYGPESFTVFSYAGDGEAYSAKDTWGGPDASVAQLIATLQNIADKQPGRPIAIVAHSQGGIIALNTVMALGENVLSDPSLPVISHVVIVASPVHGSDAASAGVLMFDELGLGRVANAVQQMSGLGRDTLPLAAPAIRALDPFAPERAGFASRWVNGWQQAYDVTPHGPFVLAPRVVSVSGQSDLVVTKPRTRILLPDIPDEARQHLVERTLPGGHGSVKNTDALHQIVDQALSGDDLTRADGYLSHAAGSMLTAAMNLVRDVTNRALWARRPRSTG